MLLPTRSVRSGVARKTLAGVNMRKPEEKKPKKKPKTSVDPVYDAMAKQAAAEVTRKWLREPRNRTPVIMPPGKDYKPGTADYVNKTKGRYQAAGMVYDRTYADVLDFISKQNKSSQKVVKASTKVKKKK